MSNRRITWYKYRAILFAFIQKGVAFILQLPVPPKISVGAFIERDGRFLVVNLTYRKGFAFPGGMVEPGENLEEALIREIKEETGLTATKLTYYDSVPDIQYGIGVLAVVYVAEVQGDIQISDEGHASFETPDTIINNCAYKNWQLVFKTYAAAQKQSAQD